MWKTGPRTSPAGQAGQPPAATLGRAEGIAARPGETRVHVDDPAGRDTLSAAIASHLASFSPRPAPVTIVCVGSDRSTGDALGPLVGTQLSRIRHPRLIVHGTLESPVHAANLSERLEALREAGQDKLVVAVDACLGRSENVGTVCVKPGPLRPGTGVHKSLPPVGSFHIVGVVNVGGFMEYFVLQNTRLNLVMRLADLIAQALIDSLAKHWRSPALQIAATWES